MTRTALLLLALLLGAAAMAATMRYADFRARPQPDGGTRIAYGTDPLQHVDLWLPKGDGPHPVVLMVHGGCWQSDVGSAGIMNALADDLTKRGIAVWNIEYRGIDRPGGGYPGTFLNVAAAADALRANAARYHLRADRIVAVGHSAGGHLALWLAARGGIAASSPLHAADPLGLAAVVGLGALPDLAAAEIGTDASCGAGTVDRLVGQPGPTHSDVYSDTSPARLPQPAIPITLISGAEDTIVPPFFGDRYVRRPGVKAQHIVVPGEGHFELIVPESAAWARAVGAIEAALKH